MRKIYKINGLFCLFLILLSSCQEDNIASYSGPVAVNMSSNGSREFGMTFVESGDILESTFDIVLSVQGEVSYQDRVVKFVFGDKQTAVSGTNFEMPGEALIPAGELTDTITCKVFKAGLTYDPLLIDLQIAPNVNFECGGVYGQILVKVMLGYPTEWYASEGDIFWADYLLGKCTQARYKFVSATIGTIDLKEYALKPWGAGFTQLAKELNALLEKNPLLDDDGSNMKFGM
ncbi:MAG: hypothetical protein RR137_05485 [Odoribacter sp.]